jgi:putative membrane protein
MNTPGKTTLATVFAVSLVVLAAPLFAQNGDPKNAPESPSSPATNKPAPPGSHGMAHGMKSGSLAAADRTFVREAAKGGMAEVEMGKLAASKATNPEVKAFGQKMVDDHSKANDQLRQVASGKGMQLPTNLDTKSRAAYNHLEKLSGDAFDRAYVKMMVKDHVQDVAAFDKEAKSSGADSDVQQFASSTLPTLRSHLSMINDINSKMGGGSDKSMNVGH